MVTTEKLWVKALKESEKNLIGNSRKEDLWYAVTETHPQECVN